MKSRNLHIALIFLVGGGLFPVSCGLHNQNTSRTHGDIPVETVFVDFNSFVGTAQNAGYAEVVLRSAGESSAFMQSYLGTVPDEHPLFGVDYSTYAVIGVASKPKPNNSYQITIQELINHGNQIEAHVVESGSAGGGRVIVWPAHFVKVPLSLVSSKPVQFEVFRVCELDPCQWD